MKPGLWRALAVTAAAILFAFAVLDTATALFANGDSGFSAHPISTSPHMLVVDGVNDPGALSAPLHPGDRVRLEDRSFMNGMRFLRSRIGDRFVLVGTTKDGAPLRIVDTMRPAPIHVTFWIYDLLRLAFLIVGTIVAVRRPADRVARWMVALFFAIPAIFGTTAPWLPLWMLALAIWIIPMFARIYAAYAALGLAVNFPEPSRHGVRTWLARANPWLLWSLILTAYPALYVVAVRMTAPPQILTVFDTSLTVLYFLSIGVAFFAAYRSSAGADRQRVRWVGWSVGTGFSGTLAAIFILYALKVPVGSWLAWIQLTLIAIPLGLGYAIVRHRVVDIGFVVNRALVFGILSGIVIVAFMVLEWLLSSVFVRISHITSTSLELALALVLGFSLRSLHARVDAFVDDLFFRDRHANERALKTFAREIAYVTEPRVAVARAHAELTARTGAAEAAVYVVAGRDAVRVDPAETAAQDRVDLDDPVLVRMRATRLPVALADVESAFAGDHAFPMCVRDIVTGAVVLGAKTNGEAYAPDEVATVETVVLALGNALDALQTAALKAEIARVLLDGAPIETLRRTVDPAGWVRGVVPQPAGSLPGHGE
jgi:hypothetical protein